MLIKVTNYCSMGCSHCMEDSTIKGQHMTEETFLKALALTEKLEEFAYQAGCQRLVLLSGGECTEHPDIVRFIELTYEKKFVPLLITNGSWLANDELRASILRPEWKNLSVQVTNDQRFYPRTVPRFNDKRIVFVDSLTMMMPLGRFAGKTHWKIPNRTAPSSFNLRSATRQLGDVRKALAMIRVRAAMGHSGHCSPSIADDGSIMAGETRNCFKVGDVDSTPEMITRALIGMQCNKCGLVNNLTQEQKLAIGEARVLVP